MIWRWRMDDATAEKLLSALTEGDNMKLVVRSVGTDLNPNIRPWEPENPGVISELVHLNIGPS